MLPKKLKYVKRLGLESGDGRDASKPPEDQTRVGDLDNLLAMLQDYMDGMKGPQDEDNCDAEVCFYSRNEYEEPVDFTDHIDHSNLIKPTPIRGHVPMSNVLSMESQLSGPKRLTVSPTTESYPDYESRGQQDDAKAIQVVDHRYHWKSDEYHTRNEQRLKREIVSWKQVVEKKSGELAQLLDNFNRLQHAKDADKESYENRLQTLRNEFRDMKEQLVSENTLLAKSVEKYKAQNNYLLSSIAQIEDALVQDEEDQFNQMTLVQSKNRLSSMLINSF